MSDYSLKKTENGLELHAPEEKKFKPLLIDFDETERLFKKSQSDLLKKAIGRLPEGMSVLDVTMGFASDSFRLARYGYKVISCERVQQAFAIVEDAFQRFGDAANMDWTLIHTKVQDLPNDFCEQKKVSVIYADPMFPERKSASGKELQILQDISPSDDQDTQNLVDWVFAQPVGKIVIKRPVHAPVLSPTSKAKPSHQFEGKTIRYDIYVRA